MARRELLSSGAGLVASLLTKQSVAQRGGFVTNGIYPAFWSPVDLDPHVTVSHNTSSLNANTGGGWVMGRSDTSQSFGLRYVEFTVLVAGDTANYMGVGISNGVPGLNVAIGTDTNSIGYGSQGNVLYNNSFQSSPPAAYVAGDVLGMLVDFTAGTVKFNLNNSAFSPAYNISAVGTEKFLVCQFNSASLLPSVKINTIFTYALPTGATPWNDSPLFPAATLNIVNDGDSISLTSVCKSIYLVQLAALIATNNKGKAYWTRCGINGASWAFAWSGTSYPYTITQDAPLRADIAKRNGLTNWLIPFAGTDGLNPFLGNHSAATEYADFQTYIAARIAAGWNPTNIIVCTMLPRTGQNETIRAAYNASLVSGAATYGYQLARLDLDPNIGQAGDNLNTTYYTGGAHPTDAGHAIIASIIYQVIINTI